MPSYLDFNSTKRFRDFIIGKTINRPNGPQTFTNSNYTVQNTNEFPNIDLPEVDANRSNDLLLPKGTNIFKPFEYLVRDNFDTIQRRANLSLYWNGTPYFLPKRHNLLSVLTTNNFDNESELFKFAATTIKNDPNGPFQSRVRQNLESSTIGRIRLLDALNGNTSTAFNIVTGKEPLIEFNNKITVSKTLPGKGIDFLQTLAGFEFPFSEIPGDYLTNPRNPINVRPNRSEVGSTIQDITGVVGSLIGIQRRPKQTRKPSDLMIEYMGEGQRRSLFDLLTYSTYAPNYTTTARSQNSSKIFNFVDQTAQGIKTLLGVEAPRGFSYIGDDRGEDVTFAMNDFFGRPVKSNFYLSLLFDPIQARLFQRERNVSEGGQISGKLTWYSRNSKNKLGENNDEWGVQQSRIIESLSTNFQFRDDSILGKTQDLLDSMPLNGAESRSHVGNVIDQTSRIFREGDVMLSRGSAIQYVDKFGGESGVEYCRVWTKDRSYFNYSDTMKRTGNVRKYGDSVMTKPWDLNISPYSNNSNSDGDDFNPKKYMFSLENLAWKTSQIPGFSYSDLPYCERGTNDGRVMWFPPYDLKINEQNQAKWDSNTFVGRPEPIYTYQHTERTGTLSFKIVVDHPSILNLLVNKHFEGMSDEESENYINSFFAGCEDLDFYDLIKNYTTLTPEDVGLINRFMTEGKSEDVVESFRDQYNDIVLPSPETESTPESTSSSVYSLNFQNDFPKKNTNNIFSSDIDYGEVYNQSFGNVSYITTSMNELDSLLRDIYTGTTTSNKTHDKDIMLKNESNLTPSYLEENIINEKDKLVKIIDKAKDQYEKFNNDLNSLNEQIGKGEISEIKIRILSTTSAAGDNEYNYRLSVRRSHSIVKEVINKIQKVKPIDKWSFKINPTENEGLNVSYTFKELGYDELNGNVSFIIVNLGENSKYEDENCGKIEFKYKDLTAPENPKTLLVLSPIAFSCRASNVSIEVTKKSQPTPNEILNENKQSTRLILDTRIGSDTPTKSIKPLIDPMKKIVMKTLSECHYFKKLEETDPIVFGSLKEKLKYFHPAFHSTTPEGLNSRLTFLLQCVRPGDTIPIKGLSEDEDLNSRNTSFGPPPICVLRIGDFYHSKVIIRNVDITYEDNITWDLNPEGIGVQPMIANVTLQISFIGGQGIKEPVSKLQNALSSNFFANTEMYDERSINTAGKINGEDRELFTKKFLEDIQKNKLVSPMGQVLNSENEIIEGFIGTINTSNNTIQYNDIVDSLYNTTVSYFNTYESTYNKTVKQYGPIVSSLLFQPIYRKVTNFEYFTGSSSQILELHGEYEVGKDLSKFVDLFKNEIVTYITNTNMTDLFGLGKILNTPEKQNNLNRALRQHIIDFTKIEINKLNEFNVGTLGSIRNDLIKTLDNLNFVVNNGFDASSIKQVVTKSELKDFVKTEFYDEYVECITIITGNTLDFYNDLDNGVILNFFNPVFDLQKLKDILSIMILGHKTEILNILKSDEKIFNDKSYDKIIKNVNSFFDVKFVEKKFKFKQPKTKRKSNLTFEILSQSVVDNNEVIEKLLLTRSTIQTQILFNKLNFYRR